ncbi:MAG: glutamyl-tRNA reductase [Rhabdochlamydiaceae bacterium]
MKIGVIGINHKSSDLILREFVAKSANAFLKSNSDWKEQFSLVFLSTCNRTEIYFSFYDLSEAHRLILSMLSIESSCPLGHAFYSYFGVDCFTHLSLVCSGLDSVVVGESDIQHQVKTSYQQALLEYSLTKDMHYLFQKSFKVAKEIRSAYPNMKSAVTLDEMVLRLIKKMSPIEHTPHILFVGNSDINRKLINCLQKRGSYLIDLCTRSPQSAKSALEQAPINIQNWDKIPNWMNYDLMITGTKTDEFLIIPEQIKGVMRCRLILDLGVPRNVDPRIGLNPFVQLLNIDDLGRMIQQHKTKIADVTQEAENLVKRSLLSFQKNI